MDAQVRMKIIKGQKCHVAHELIVSLCLSEFRIVHFGALSLLILCCHCHVYYNLFFSVTIVVSCNIHFKLAHI